MKPFSVLRSAALFAALISGYPAAAATLQMAAALDWSDGNAAALQKVFSSREEVREFLSQIAPQSSALDGTDFDHDNPAVMDYGFEDMNGDGKLELLARLDYSGRGLSSYLIAVYPSSDGFDAAMLNAEGRLGPLSAIIVDLAGTGRKEVLDSAPLATGADSAAPVASFLHIYQFANGAFRQADGEYRSYYRTRLLPSLEKKLLLRSQELTSLQAQGATQAATRKRDEIDSIQGSIAAIKNFLHD